MSEKKDNNLDVEKLIQTEKNITESFNKEITSNTGGVAGDIPSFTTGDGDSSGGSESDNTDSAE